MLKAFIDTCVVRNSQQIRIELEEINKTITWGDREFTLPILQKKTIFPNNKFLNEGNLDAFNDSKKIQKIEKLARLQLIDLFWHPELHWEFISKRQLKKGRVSIIDYLKLANDPVRYSRIVASGISNEDYQFKFLKSLKHHRFEAWKEASGVVPDSKKERNQTLDAFHLWTAEHNWCDYFVTMDYRLVDKIKRSKMETELKVVVPSELLHVAYCHIPAVLLERLCKRIP